MKHRHIYVILVLVALCFSLFAYVDWKSEKINVLDTWNQNLEDVIYQQPESLENGKIVILGIDEQALEDLGPWPWDRSVCADLICLLNQDPECAPAVIGFDVLFAGYKTEDEDNYLVEAASMLDNVVFADMATFENDIEVNSDGTFYVNDFKVKKYERPFAELEEVAVSGFMNNMPGIDGIIRNSMLHIKLEDGEVRDSLSYAIYKKYAKKYGIKDQVEELVPMDSRYRWYLPYAGGPSTFDEISVSSLLNGETDPSELADCIVLVGAYTEGLQDSYYTSISHDKKMYGIEIHANAIWAMLHSNYKRYANAQIQFVLLTILLCILSIAFHKLKLRYVIAIWIGTILAYLGIGYWLYTRNVILHVIYVPLYVTLLMICEIALKYVKAAIEKRKTVGLFKSYVAPQVVDEILKAGADTLELGGKMMDIACLFVDIRGFTPMSEVLTPPQVVDVLNTYLNLTNECIMKNEGTLDKFIGDATMAIYNAPLPLNDYVYKAVKTAWDMVQGAEELGKALKEKYGRNVSFGIGVHCGKAVVGNIGTKMRMDYTAIGDTVNTSARLEANAKPGEILISKDVYEVLKERIEVTSYGTSIKLKGKSEEFEIFRVDRLLEE